MTSTRVLAWVGAALIGLGLLVGFAVPVHAEGVSCGTALRASKDADGADLFDTLSGNSPRTGTIGGVGAACDEARNGPKVIVWVIIGLGAVVAVTGAVIKAATDELDPAGRSSRGAAS